MKKIITLIGVIGLTDSSNTFNPALVIRPEAMSFLIRFIFEDISELSFGKYEPNGNPFSKYKPGCA